MARIDHPNIGDIAKTKYLKGVIVSTDSEDDTCEVAISGLGTQLGVPIFYHCEATSTKRPNGALEGGSAAFAKDDEVIVLNKNGELKVIGFADGSKKPCATLWKFKIRDFDFDLDADVETAAFIANPSALAWESFKYLQYSPSIYFSNGSFAMAAVFERGDPGSGPVDDLIVPDRLIYKTSSGNKTIVRADLPTDAPDMKYNSTTKICTFPSTLSDLAVPAGNTGFYGNMDWLARYNRPQPPGGTAQVHAFQDYPDNDAFFFENIIQPGPEYTYLWTKGFFLF